jgi:hypothetical protein
MKRSVESKDTLPTPVPERTRYMKLNSPKDLKAAMVLARAGRFIYTVLERAGFQPPGRDHLDEFLRLGEQILEVTEFNDVFASRGWIAHGKMNVEAALAAMSAARSKDWARADIILAESYSPGMVRALVARLGSLRCFRDRDRLARLAIDDYEAERYHACIPIVLALIDGMGQQATGAGLFRQGARFIVPSSFIGLGDGLGALLKTILAPRKRTTTTSIEIPYRHGIVHGTDLAYDTRVVAAKTWSALFAAAEYAESVERPPKEPPHPGLMETLRGYADHRKSMGVLEQYLGRWTTRSKAELDRVIEMQVKTEGAPETAALDLIGAWQSKNFGAIAELSVDATKQDSKRVAGELRRILGLPPTSFRVVEIVDEAPALSSVNLILHWHDIVDEVELRMLCCTKDGQPAPSGMPGANWRVSSLWPLEAVRSRTVVDADLPSE